MDNYKITADEFEKVSIARMATHPNSSTAYGESKLSAADLKKRFDAQGKLFCKKFNEFLAMIPGGGEGDSLAAHILTGIEENHTLKDMFADIVAKGGVFASYLSVGDQSLLQKLAALESADLTLAEKLHLLEEEGEAINEQIAALKQADAQIRQEMVDGFDKSVPTKIGAHNAATDSHNDIRLLIEGLTARLNAVANSSDVDLDQLAELVAYIKSNRSLIEEITTSKVNVKDIIDNLTTNVNNKPLSAAQGVMLKNLIDAIVVPTKLSELADDADHRTISDAERRKWNAGGSSVLEVIETYTANDNVVISQQSVSSGMWSNRKMDIYPGTVYAVYINGEVYFCTAHEYDGGVYLGNITLMDSSATDPHNNEPFCVYWAGGSATGGFFYKDSTLSNSVTLKVTGAAVTTEYKLPTKYLHDDVARTVAVDEHNESAEAHMDIRMRLDAIKVPTKLSELSGDSTHRTVTDSEKSAWSGKENAGVAAGLVNAHNVGGDAHNDIRLLIEGLNTRLNAVANSSDVNLDQLAELVAYIKANRSLIEQVTTNKVSVSDIINNLTTNVSNKPLSAAQGVALKALIDAITVPTKLSELAEDSDHRTVTDAEKEQWNKGGVQSWNDLTDKPFSEGAGELWFTYTATFATDAAAKNGVQAPCELTNTLSWLEVNGELLKVHKEQEGMVVVWRDADGNQWVTSTFAGVYVSAQTAGTYTYKFYAPSDELMLEPKYLPPNLAKKSDIPEGGGADIDVVASVGQTIVVEEVDADGKPTKWKAAEFQERTHWSEEGKVPVLDIPVGVSGLDTTYGAFTFNLLFNEYAGSIPLSAIMSVEYDGVEYTNLAGFASGGMQFFGNLYFLNTIFGTSFENTGEPFIIGGDTSGMIVLTTDNESTRHSIQIYIEGTYHHRIDRCYQPQLPVVDLTKYYTTIKENGATTISGDNYYEEVYRVLRENDMVKVLYVVSENGVIATTVVSPVRAGRMGNVVAVSYTRSFMSIDISATRESAYIVVGHSA
jgi:hemerythrin-like domain-containing protein